MSSISEFFTQIREEICKGMYEGLKGSVSDLFAGMMDVMNNQISQSKDLVTQSPQSWNASAFSFIQSVSENAFIPVAAVVIGFVFCMEYVHMIQEENNMRNITKDKIVVTLLKLCACLLICGKSFDIVMGLFELSSYSANKVAASATVGSIPSDISSLFEEPAVYDFKCVFAMLGNYLITFICWAFTYVISIMIFLRVQLWYLELLIYASACAVPFATFINKEWGQVGQNYLRKMLAVCFEGVFMLVTFGLYKYLIVNVTSSGYISSSDFMMAMFMSLGCGVVLFILLMKVGTISASIFNAH